jgi:hypothetical protein
MEQWQGRSRNETDEPQRTGAGEGERDSDTTETERALGPSAGEELGPFADEEIGPFADEELGPSTDEELSPTRRGAGTTTAKGLFRLLFASVLLIPVGALIGGGIGLLAASNLSTTFQSEAIAVPANTKVPVGQFALLAQAVFRTDAVLQPVVSQLELDVTSRELLASGTLSAQEVPTGGALSIVALSRDPLLSRELANSAAESLVKAMAANNLGTVSAFVTDAPGELQPKPIVAYGILGAVSGAVVALGLLLTATAIRWLRSAIRVSRERAAIGT